MEASTGWISDDVVIPTEHLRLVSNTLSATSHHTLLQRTISDSRTLSGPQPILLAAISASWLALDEVTLAALRRSLWEVGLLRTAASHSGPWSSQPPNALAPENGHCFPASDVPGQPFPWLCVQNSPSSREPRSLETDSNCLCPALHFACSW